MGQFKFIQAGEVLKTDAQTKSLVIHAKAKRDVSSAHHAGEDASDADRDWSRNQDDDEPGEDDAILFLEKTPFNTNSTGLAELISADTSLEQVFNNDIYGTYASHPSKAVNSVKTVIIFPATAKHLEKYHLHDGDVIYETPEDYENITLPYLQSSTFNIQWIYNILEKKKESEFIIYEDADPVNGYILLPDLKWDKKKTSLKAIEEKYGIKSSKIRAYFHYQPSFYHLHVHFNHIKNIAAGSNVLGAHLLSDVINNIEMQSDYYKRKTLAFVSRENTELHKLYKMADRIGKSADLKP
ncbi:DCPS [Bugula neritina]|uniref:m7GpppX diphosphatase n=1 Tax=Bugula neritina TaxID=10212 RepID=A0A7J7J8V5_BUGNE|nr:DCPS [Bugula neritina]